MSELNDNNQNQNPNTNQDNGGPYYNPNPYYNPQADYNNGQYYNPQPGYNNGQYYNPQTAYQQAQPVPQPVSNVFYYILMALTAVSAILTIAATIIMIRSSINGSLFSSLTPGQNYASIYALLLDAFTNSPTLSLYPALNQILRIAILVVSIIDIVQVRGKGYPILGMILFAIFFKPGYFIWRAYAAKQPKLVPILFTVFYVLLHVGYFLWFFFYLISLM